MNRVLKSAKEKLQAAGIKVVDWEPYKSMEILQLIVRLLLPPILFVPSPLPAYHLKAILLTPQPRV